MKGEEKILDVYKKLESEYTKVRKYKFWRSESVEGRNGVGIMVREDLVQEVKRLRVKRLDNRMMKIAMVCGRKILHVFSEYAPQQS